MQVDGVPNVNTGTIEGARKRADETMGKDAFLKLLVTQLQNQDPLNPTENTEFVAQLAQFSSLEGITNLNTSMEGVSKNISSMQNFGASALIGKNVRAEGETFALAASPVTLGYELSGDSTDAALTIRNSSGSPVRVLDLGRQAAGYREVSWDGANQAGAVVPKGRYTFSVEAKDGKNPVYATTYIRGQVSGVSLDGGRADLVVDGTTVARDMLREIY